MNIDVSVAIKSISEALQLVEDGEINESLEVVTEKLQDIMIRIRQQKKITDYIKF